MLWFALVPNVFAQPQLHTQSATAPAPRWQKVPRVQGRMTAADLGVVINTADPYSVAVGEYYVERRGIPPEQVLRVELPVRPALSVAEFGMLYAQIREQMGPQVQGLALAWTQPFMVECNSITSAVTLGLELELCKNTCAQANPSRYFNAATSKPFSDLGMRPSMLLASLSIESGKALVDRGIASDGQLGRLGGPPVLAVFARTDDKSRNVRAPAFPPPGEIKRMGVQVVVRQGIEVQDLQRVFIYQTGLTRMTPLKSTQWVPGALADHLTSSGGQLLGAGGQMSALAWLEAGATASYGTVSEPCNYPNKFPHPQLLFLHYIQGETALEAYWRSVAWPGQGVFVGEPLAAPFAR